MTYQQPLRQRTDAQELTRQELEDQEPLLQREEDQETLVPRAQEHETVRQEMDDSVVLRFENRRLGSTPLCRFCRHPHFPKNPLLVPCHCTHEHRFVHKLCMRSWLQEHSILEEPACHVCGCAIHLDVSFCRICHGHGGLAEYGQRGNELISPCRCEGPGAFVHRSCLTALFAKDKERKCPQCRSPFATRRRIGPTDFSFLVWGVPSCRPYHKTAFWILCPLHALSSVGVFTTFALHLPREVTLALFSAFLAVSWILIFVAVFVRVYTEGRFIEFCSKRGNSAPVLPPEVEARTSEVGRLAASMPLSSPIFREPQFLRRMVQDFTTDAECLLPERPPEMELSTKSETGPLIQKETTSSKTAFNSSYGSI